MNLVGLSKLRKWVARALYQHDHPEGVWEHRPEHHRELYRERADAVLAAVKPALEGVALKAWYSGAQAAYQGVASRLRASGENQAAETLDQMAAELEHSEVAEIVNSAVRGDR